MRERERERESVCVCVCVFICVCWCVGCIRRQGRQSRAGVQSLLARLNARTHLQTHILLLAPGRRDSAPPNSADEGAKQPAACPARVAVPPTPACLLPVNVYARIYV